MSNLTVVEKSKDFLKSMLYNIRYGRKFKNLSIDKSFSEMLIYRSEGVEEKAILNLISKSKDKLEFGNNVKEYLKSKEINSYAGALLLGNVTGKYVFNDFYFNSLKKLNLDAFSEDNQELLEELKSHFMEYVTNNNNLKNIFAERIKIEESSVKDLSKDINEKNLYEEFEKVINGKKIYDIDHKDKVVIEYILKIMGTYSKEDIKDNFDFILYDINRDNINSNDSLDERRKK